MPANSVFNLITAAVGLVALVLRIRYHIQGPPDRELVVPGPQPASAPAAEPAKG